MRALPPCSISKSRLTRRVVAGAGVEPRSRVALPSRGAIPAWGDDGLLFLIEMLEGHAHDARVHHLPPRDEGLCLQFL